MDITAHQLRCCQRFAKRKTAAHGEGLVHANQTLDPWIDEQVIANTYLNGSRIASIYEQHIEKRRIEHDISMIAHKGIALALIV